MLFGATVTAQLLTIPEALARAGVDLAGGPGLGSGALGDVKSTECFRRSTARLLADTDTVVSGRVGQPGSAYLSDDQREVYTDYLIENPIFLYQRSPVASRTPGVIARFVTRTSVHNPNVTAVLMRGELRRNGRQISAPLPLLPAHPPPISKYDRVRGHQYDRAGAFRPDRQPRPLADDR